LNLGAVNHGTTNTVPESRGGVRSLSDERLREEAENQLESLSLAEQANPSLSDIGGITAEMGLARAALLTDSRRSLLI